MKQSMVDYVLERGNRDYGQFYRRSELTEPSARMNQRKLLEYLFNPDRNMKVLNRETAGQPSISELKFAEIVTQFNYVSQKLHMDMNKKNIVLDGEIYKLEQQWNLKRIPEFYCYYFLKFCYANKVSRLQDIIYEEQTNMAKDNDGYTVIKKAIEARQACLINLRREAVDLTPVEIEKDLRMIQDEMAYHVRQKVKGRAEAQNYKLKTVQEQYPVAKDWKNKLQLLFESISHMRKLTLYVADMIIKWKNMVYGLTDDPKKYRERIIFYHNGVNYLIKILNDSRFLKEMYIGQYLTFSQCYDPFVLRPLVVLESGEKTIQQSILYSLLKPKEQEMKKIILCLELFAEEEYDEDSHSRFLSEKKNTGELQFRKDRAKEEIEGTAIFQTQKKTKNPADLDKQRAASVTNIKTMQKTQPPKSSEKERRMSAKGSLQKKSMQFKNRQEDIEAKKSFLADIQKVKAMSALQLKKLSPYLARNQKIELAKKVIELEHEYKQAKALYAMSTRKDIDEALVVQQPKQVKEKETEVPDVESLKNYTDTRVFNKYVEENLRKLEEADKKKYLYKNRLPPEYEGPKVNYRKMKFQQRKEFKYNQNLKQLSNPLEEKPEERKKIVHHPEYKAPGTKAVIEISDIGIKRKDKEVLFTMPTKTVGQAMQRSSAQDFQKKAVDKLYPQYSQMVDDQRASNAGLYELGRQPEIIVLRQQPEKLEEIKNFLYAKIKAELTEQIQKQNKDREDNIRDLIEEEKRKRANELMEQQRLEEERRKQEEQRLRLEQLERERNKINLNMSVEPIQYAEENLEAFLKDQVLILNNIAYSTLFGYQLETLFKKMTDSLYCLVFRVRILDEQVGYVITMLDDRDLFRRKWHIIYMGLKETAYSVSSFHYVSNYLWLHDPVEQIQLVLIDNKENQHGNTVIQDIQEYSDRNGLSFSKQLYSNTTENKYVFVRNTVNFPEGVHKDRNNLYSASLNMKVQLLSANVPLTQGIPSKIDLNLQHHTHYIFLLEELFRGYMTPEEVVELRENTQNIRRLKDIFKIVLDLEKNKPKVDQLHVVQGLNIPDLNDKIKQATVKPYQKYYWSQYYDMDQANRLLLAILEDRLVLPYAINACSLSDRPYMRLRLRSKILTLKSSISPKDVIYIIPTHNEKLKLFVMSAVIFKQMRIELFMFLNLLFNNIVRDERQHIENMWVPQFMINDADDDKAQRYCKKKITRVSDFSITMKKNIWLSEEVYFCNKEYIKPAVSYSPHQTDVVFLEPLIFGVLHSDIEKESPGVPLYGRLIDKNEYYRPWHPEPSRL